MSNKKLSFLGIIAVISVAGAIFVSQAVNRSKTVSSGTGYLIQGLDPAAIAKISIGRGGEAFTLGRAGSGFVVEDKDNYPADTKMINNLLTSCFDIRTVELYTQDEANYKDLGVAEEDAQGVVKFFDVNGKIITGVIIGKDSPSGGMYYGRKVGEKGVYVMENVPWPGASPLEYIDKSLITINKTEIASITVTSPEGSYNLAAEANSTDAAIKELPAGEKEKKNECNQVFSAIMNLRFDDVWAVSNMTDLKFDREYACLMKDSTLYLIEIAQKDSKYYIKCNVDFTDKTQVVKEQGVESQEELGKKEAKLLAKEKARNLQETFNGWVYEIPAHRGEYMTKPLTELVEDITPAATKETEKGKK
ncbi:MAG: DUF4340 domain-containing protein [Phycisphaerae bacterium]|nr:DUF4340 domain-containing protein [Phycisphaerae bacterium]